MVPRTVPALICLMGMPLALNASDIKKIPGHGSALAEKSMFGQEKENQKALDQAQRKALEDAMQQALVKSLGHGQLEPERIAALVQDLKNHSSAFIRESTVTDAHMEGLNAIVEVLLKVDFTGLQEFLETRGVSLTQNFEAKLKFIVLSYSLEGMDADRSKPIVLHEEVRAESQSSQGADYQASSSSSANLDAGSAAHAAVVTDDGAAMAARRSHISANSQDDSQVSASSFAQGSASYYRVTDYADPTKKGMGGNSEARNMIEGALQKAGLQVATIEAPLVGEEFRSEDAFVNRVLQSVRKHPEVKPEDCVAIAINSLTPIQGRNRGHQFTSRVSARFVRVGDGVNLLPSDSVSKTSQSLPSDDEARTQATNLAVLNLTDRLPDHIRKNLQKLQREAGRTAPAAAGIYLLEIQNIQDRSILVKTKQWLRQQGFNFKSDSSSGGTVETLTIRLGERSPEEVKDALDGLPASLELLAKSDSAAKVRVK